MATGKRKFEAVICAALKQAAAENRLDIAEEVSWFLKDWVRQPSRQ